jgi:hypothetical protein
METIGQRWEKFISDYLNKHKMGDHDIDLLRNSFYVGAQSAFQIVTLYMKNLDPQGIKRLEKEFDDYRDFVLKTSRKTPQRKRVKI